MKALDMIYFNSLRMYKPVFSVGRTEKKFPYFSNLLYLS